MEFADTHCHLNFEPLSSSLKEVLDRARQHAVVNILMPAVDLESSRQVIELCEEDPNLFCAIGVHPNSSLSWNQQTLAELRKLAQHPKVKAIGEIGLDYYRNRAPAEIQIQVFRQLLDLAFETGLPVIVHNRSASADTLPTLWTWRSELVKSAAPQARRPGVLHSFEGDLEAATQAIAHGFYLGVSGPITYPNAGRLQQLVAEVPLENLLLETDAPFLTPQPFRGQTNEPYRLPIVAKKIADLHTLTLSEVAEKTSRNASLLFGWSTLD